MKLIIGNIINPLDRNKYEIIEKGGLLINNDGIIVKKGKLSEFENLSYEIYDYKNNYVIPGFIDIHTHIPQYPMIGKGKGELLEWLDKYIFPAELKFENINYAIQVYEELLASLINFGTTSVVAYSSVHPDSLINIANVNESKGIRLIAGISLMDLDDKYFRISKEENLNNFEKVFNKTKDYKNFKNILTPRYAGNCSAELMKEIADFAKENNLFIQTHLSENKNEIEFIKKLHQIDSYSEIYKKSHLVTDKSIFAHCIHLNNDELKFLKNTNAIIAHCPTSNIFLKSGIMPLRRYMDMEMRIGLGTDVAGGYSLDMKTEIRNAVESSKILSVIENKDLTVSALEIFPLTNIEAAKYLNIDKTTGNLNVGKYADVTVINNNDELSLNPENIINDIIYNENKESVATFYKGELKNIN